jgi:rhodanese-related sulfurtransferase
MKNDKALLKYLIALLIIPAFLLVGCKGDDDDDDTPETPKFEILKQYLVDNNMDITDVVNAWITDAATVNGNEASYYIMDLRSATDYAAGHIQGAVNVTLANVVSEAQNAGGKPILVVCYTGQTAGHATVALRLSGYADAKVLKWGMSGWNSSCDKWTANVSDTAIGHANWVTTATATVNTYDDPVITTSATDGATILAERVNKLLTDGFQGVNGIDVLTTPTNYFINNYWAEADVNTYGHIDGAYRIMPLSLAGGEYKNLDPNQTVVTYCWTGQTSSMMTAYLYVIGYQSKSLKFGVNSMIHANLTGHNWTGTPTDLPLTTK